MDEIPDFDAEAAATLRHDDMATERTYIMIKCVCERDAGEARTRTIVARETSSFFSRDATARSKDDG